MAEELDELIVVDGGEEGEFNVVLIPSMAPVTSM